MVLQRVDITQAQQQGCIDVV